MLYWLLFTKLQHYFPPFRIFRYVTFRTAFASLTALFTALIVGPLVINRLREFQIGQYIREEGPKAHQKKAGTPTMGGLLIAIAVVVPTLSQWGLLLLALLLGGMSVRVLRRSC